MRSEKKIKRLFSDAISKRHFQLNDDVYADYVENLLSDISKEPDDVSNFAYGDDSKYEWWKLDCLIFQKCGWKPIACNGAFKKTNE